MNKKEFITELSNQLSYTEDKCVVINEILENNFFISKKSKDKIVVDLERALSISSEEAIKIYDIAVKIVKDEVKNKMRYPFKSKD